MGLGTQFLLLLWKNWTISRRKVCATVLEIILPIGFALLLLVIRMLVKTESFPSPTMYEPFQVNDLNAAIPSPARRRILFSPNETKIFSVMDKLQISLGSNASVIAFNSEEAILTYLETNKDNVWAAVIFDSADDYTTSLPDNIKYSLRVARIDKDRRWRTNRNFPFFQNPWYRNNDTDGGEPDYMKTGFLALQYAVDKAIIDEQNPSNQLDSMEISLQKMAFPSFLKDELLSILRVNLPLFLMLGYIVTVFQTTKNIVHEKETRIKESMKLMGLNPTIYWLSWFTKVFIYLFIASAIFTVIFALKINGASVLNKTSPLLVFIFLILFGISIICYCFMMSTFFKSANAGAYAAGIIYYLFYVPNYFLSDQYENMTQASKLGVCLLNVMSMSFGVTTLTLYEGTGEGAQFSNFYKPATVDDNFSLLLSIIMLIFDSIIYSLIAWYVENVRPGDYGVPLPFYFPFTKTYWCGTSPAKDLHDINSFVNTSDTFEQDPSELSAGISIRHLRKEFGRGKNKKIAVADTSLNMYEGQISVVLGHNGAGKTTTMSMLTGFIPPTKGTAIVNNYDIRNDINGVRGSLGLCPQHNILFDLLTVEEHLQFFAKMKGVAGSGVKPLVDNMINILGLQSKRRCYSYALSGGQKRKLSVGIALMGDPKVVILDEPTSGMDPAARRETWDILQKYKEGRTIVLTTHFMDEADLLGDRIAIMAEGVVKCCGTSHFLKKKYGAGYHLVLVKNIDCDVSKVTHFIQGHISKVVLKSNISAELTYLLPFDESKKFEDLFNEMEQKSADLGLTSFGTSATTMEEVFLKVGEGAKSEDDDDDGNGLPTDSKVTNSYTNPSYEQEKGNPSTNGYEMQNVGEPRRNAAFFNSNIVKNTGLTLSVQQFYGMFVKKAIHSWRNRIVTIVQLSLPVIFTIFALLVETTTPASGDEPALLLDFSPYEGTATATYSAGKSGSTPVTSQAASLYKDLFTSYSTVDFDTKSQSTMDDFFVSEADRLGISSYRSKHIIGAEFSSNTSFTGYFNGEPFHSPAVSLGYMMTMLYRMYTTSNVSITTTNHPLPLLLSEKQVSTGTLVTGFLIAYFTIFGMAFLSTSFILFLIKERQTGAKHLQKVSGVSSFAYWFSNFCWDFINYLLPVFLIMIVYVGFQSKPFVYDNRLGIVFLIFLIYGMCCLPFVYVLHFLFSVPSTGMVVVTMLNIVTGLAALLTVFILSIPSLGSVDVADSLDWVFTVVIPHYCLGQALNNMYVNYDNIQACEKFNFELICTYDNTLACCSGCTSNCINFDTTYLGWEKPGVLKNLIFMLIQGTLYTTIVFLIEAGVISRIGYYLKREKSSSVSSSTLNIQEENLLGETTEDSDVKHERNRINESALTKLMETDALIIKNLSKKYGNHHAVKGINIGVAKQECFGLLGQNGAGKTTTFKMLTGDVFITHGNAYLNMFDVKRHLRQVQQNLGYCPQFDALIDQMTGEETLTMYARLRGVQEKQIPQVVSDMIEALMLKKYAKRNCANYSGGNKRKLSTAIALIGDPPFILLDEPTTGMDPAARRKLWNVLSDVRASGRTLILTSHSMEECDALCTKIVIMVNGKFVCLGSPQHLKNKFGHGYTLIMRLGTDKAGYLIPPDPIKNYIKTTFPTSEIFDDHQGYIHFQIPDSDIPLGKIFGKMENAKNEFHIEDYSVHQTTLEQVFLSFTRNQIQPKEKKKGRRCLPCCR